MKTTLATPVGPLTITATDVITSISFEHGEDAGDSPLLREARAQLEAYFAGSLRRFDLPLGANGTAFQRAVWDALVTIPYGERRSYGDIARALSKPRATRAVGAANHRNPLPIVVPCHRVVGSDGTLTGYAGGLDKKAFLLALETRR